MLVVLPSQIDVDMIRLEQKCEAKTGFSRFKDSFPHTDEVREDPDFVCASEIYAHALAVHVLQNAIGKPARNYLYDACSFGFGPYVLNSYGHRGIGIDISCWAVHMARERGIDARVGNAFQLDFPDETFDLVISRDFLRFDYWIGWNPHAKNSDDAITRLLGEQYRVAKQGAPIVSYSLCSDERLDDYYVDALPFKEHRIIQVNKKNSLLALTFFIDILVK